ncbi:MAG: DNA polymerase beta domain-containing protein [Parcubacteria group bacterium Gr01-1014_33]|nr:MAG: DNA polymerase beta domain-containing protein [Parcubacteria group bacterium Gr01-1014_33]
MRQGKKIELTQEEHTKLFKRGVEAVYLFGSYAEGRAHPLSDVDFAVLMEDSRAVSPKASTLDLYQELFDILAPHAPRDVKDIDIVFLQRAPLELQCNVVRLGKVIFEKDPQRRLDFETRVVLLYADFKPLLTLFDHAILERI